LVLINNEFFSVAVPEGERVFVLAMETGIGYIWKPIPDPYSVCVASPKIETKFMGIKSFIAYQLTPSFKNIAVSRRYKHFDWLHLRLVDKFSLIPIPPLPGKQIFGRYEEQFIEHRRIQLQEFVDWLCRHPVLSTCEVWMNFLTCTDDKRWKKIGKRAAKKDVLRGVTYCAAIFPPEKQLLQSQVDSQIDICHTFVHSMGGAVNSLIAISDDQKKKLQMQWQKDYQRVGEGLAELATALEVDERRAVTHICLSNSVGQAAGAYIAIGQMFYDQPKFDWVPFADRLHIYRGILNAFPDVLSKHKNGMQKRKECEKLTAEQKMGNAQLQEVNRRTDIMSYAVMSEMSHFRSERDTHMKETLRNFLDAQIQFHQEVVKKLELVKQFFD
jgi:sorting nexin-9/18/33